MEDDEKELEHSSLQEKLDKELKELDRNLEQKEVKVSVIYLYCIVGIWLYFWYVSTFFPLVEGWNEVV